MRFINNQRPREELFFTRNLRTNTKDGAIFNVDVTHFKESSIPLKYIAACATNDWKIQSFITLLKKCCPRCILHTLCDTPTTLSCKAIGRITE